MNSTKQHANVNFLESENALKKISIGHCMRLQVYKFRKCPQKKFNRALHAVTSV